MSHPQGVRRAGLLAAGMSAVLILGACGGDGDSGSADGGGDEAIVGLITKTDSNPFFVKMKEGAQEAASEEGITLQTFAGKRDGDNESQVQAIESLISAGAKGFLIVPNDSKAIVPTIDKARQQGMVVIALDTETDPADAVDATFATDNYQAGLLIGQWAKAKFESEGKEAKIALLDATPNQVTVEVQRDQGFLEGFGVDVKDETRIGDEDDPRIVGHDVTEGSEEGGRTAMENLLQRDPDINLVYTINEPAAAGAYQALKAAGKAKDVTIVSVDGSCPGVDNVESGVIGATAMQFPLDMASLGVEAISEFAKNGTEPEAGFTNTGVQLITDEPQPDLESEDSAWGKENCWG